MTDLPALLEAIDAATERACAQCDGSLDGSPSEDFCSQDCQRRSLPAERAGSQRSDVDRHAARLGVEVNDLNQDHALSWPAYSMRGVITEGLRPVMGDRPTALPVEAPSYGPPQRRRAPRVLGRSR